MAGGALVNGRVSIDRFAHREGGLQRYGNADEHGTWPRCVVELLAVGRPRRVVAVFGVLRHLEQRTGGGVRLHEDDSRRRVATDLPRGVRHPPPVRRERAGRRDTRLHAAKRCGVSVREGERHQRELLPIGYIEQQDAASRRPGRRNVRGALFRRCQPIGGTGAIGRLPVDRGIAIAIRLERHEAAVGGPHGIPIASAECQPPRCSARFQVMHPDAYVAPVVMTECHVAFIRRHARFAVGSGRHLQRLLSARPVERVDREWETSDGETGPGR